MILVKNQAYLTGLTQQEESYIKKGLTIRNPAVLKSLRTQRPLFGKQAYLYYYEHMGSALVIPLGYLREACKIIGKAPEILDARYESPTPIEIEFKGTLRDYQQEVVDTVMRKTVGVVQATTGSGKTVMMINAICTRKQPTLVLVNTLDLLQQFKDRLVDFTTLKEEEIGVLGGGSKKLGPVTLATLQTMNTLKPDTYKNLNQIFGQIFCDEVHIVAASTFYKILNSLNAKYRYGFSATPERTDGLDKVIHFAAGPLIHKVDESHLKDVVIKPEIKYVKTDYYYPLFSSEEYQYMLNDMAVSDKRNELIFKVMEHFSEHVTALLCSRVSHVELLSDKYPEAGVITGKTPKKKRKEVLDKLRAGELTKVISTYQCFSTGIDVPGLEALIMCGPIQSKIVLKQCAGRLMRTKAGKKHPQMIYLIDEKVSLLKNQSYKVKKILRNL